MTTIYSIGRPKACTLFDQVGTIGYELKKEPTINQQIRQVAIPPVGDYRPTNEQYVEARPCLIQEAAAAKTRERRLEMPVSRHP